MIQLLFNSTFFTSFWLFSSAIKGYLHRSLRPVTAGVVSELKQVPTESHLIFTAETHNFPTGVAPFSGATTGTGGRIRDVQCVGRGGYCIAGTAGYSVGNLNIPGNFSWVIYQTQSIRNNNLKRKFLWQGFGEFIKLFF